MEHERDAIVIGALDSHQRNGKRTRRLRNKRTTGDHPNYSFIEIGQNTEKGPGYLRTLVVTQTPVRNHRTTLAWNTFKRENNIFGYFKRQPSEIFHEKTWTWLRKGNFKGETESLLIEARNNAIRTNYVKAKIDKTQQYSKCRLCNDRDETIKYIISEYSKLAQKEYKTWHDWVGKVIQWELCKNLKFDHSARWYMHKPSWRMRRTKFSGILR